MQQALKDNNYQSFNEIYDVSSGKIFIDGKDIRDYDVGVLREKFGAVFQNDIIFEDSVSEI